MSEGFALIMWIFKILTIVVSAVLYRIGGWKWKPARRYLAPTVYLSGVTAISSVTGTFTWWLWLAIIPYIAGFSMGYSNKTGKGWLKRLYCGLTISLAALPFAILYYSWLLFIQNIIMCTVVMWLWGTYNPFSSATDEEGNLGLIFFLIPVMMIK